MKDETGATIGKVSAVQNFGGGDILEIVHAGRKGVLIPFTQAAVPDIDVKAGFLRVDTAAAGLVEDASGEDEEGGEAPEKPRPSGPEGEGGDR